MIIDDSTMMSDSDQLSDNALIRMAKAGSLEAFSSLYERYLPIVYSRVRYTVPETDVEDVTQEIFIAVMKSLGSFKGSAQFTTWLRTLVNRRVADYYRKRNAAEMELAVDVSEADPSLPGLSIGSDTGLSDDRIMLRRALRRLSEDYREVLLLRFVEGMQFREIAQERGQSLEATKSLFRRSVVALRKQIEQSNA